MRRLKTVTQQNSSVADRLLLIDGHSLAFRAFYAYKMENFSTFGGQYTNAIYGFLAMLSRMVIQERPNRVAVAFDVGRKSFRTELFPDYKQQRKPTPDEFKGQVPIIEEILGYLGISTFMRDNYEADDIIASLATAEREANGRGEDLEILIATGDRDYIQLVDSVTTVLYAGNGMSKVERLTPGAVIEKYGVSPKQYPDYAALRGDPSDNLPKVPGVGEKTALKWIQTYGSLAGVIDHAEDITGAVGRNLRERIDQVTLNRKLTQMVTDLDMGVKPGDLAFGQVSVAELQRIFNDLEFGSTLKELVFPAFHVKVEIEGAELPDVELVATKDVLEWFEAGPAAPVALYLSGEEELGVVAADGKGSLIRLGELTPGQDGAVARWLESSEQKYVHSAKGVARRLRQRGYQIRGITNDTELAAYLSRPGWASYSLPDVYERCFQSRLGDGALERANALKPVLDQLVAQLQEAGAFGIYHDVELPLGPVLADMEATGIEVDTSFLQELTDSCEQRIAEHVSEARKLAGDSQLNLASPKQLQVVLFDTLQMPKTKKTKTGYSTAAKEIDKLAGRYPHPFLNHLLGFREMGKLKATIEGLISSVDSDGRVHTTFNQNTTSTGRLSSSDPNLQNIPVRTLVGRQIRRAFVPGDGYAALLTADYSQIEMRVMAHLSQDPGLIEAYRHGEDLHNYVGARVFDVPIDGVTPELRRRVKALSYGLVYGLSEYGLSEQLGISPREAKQIMTTYFERFGGVRRYLDEVVDQAVKDGFTSTLFGRRRYLPELQNANRIKRENARRAALNAPIQGTAADIIKIAMLRVARALQDAGLRSRLLLQVHDELVVEVAPDEVEAVRALVVENMDKAIELSVPLEVSVGVGANWDEAAH